MDEHALVRSPFRGRQATSRAWLAELPFENSIYTLRCGGENVLSSGRVAELADAKDLGSFGEILAGSTPVAPTRLMD